MKKNGKYCNGKKSMNMKPLAVLLALTLLVGCAVGGTIAWLTANTTPVQNTFSPSNISIELEEHTYNPTTDKLTETVTTAGVNNYKMVPGWTIPKDPWATVKANSEDCYLFVEITESGNFDEFMSYAIAEDWTQGQGQGDGKNGVPLNVIFMTVNSATTEKTFKILKDDKVTVSGQVTKEQMNALTDETRPSLTFKAYAVQLWKTNKPAAGATAEQIAAAQFSPAEAWEERPTTTSTPSNP